MQEMWNAPPGFRPSKSAPASPAKPLGISRTRSESFRITHKVPVGDTPYVKAKNAQLVDKDPEKAIPLFWAAINAGDRVDSALKDMAIVMKQQNRAEEAVEAIKSLRHRCSDQAQEALDNILLDLYKRCGRLDDQVGLLKHKLFLIQQGMAFNGKRTKTARSQGKKFQVSVEQEATRLLGNLGWALMQQNNYVEAEDAYRRALLISPDNNKMCNLGICLMKQGRITEAKETLRRVKPAVADGPRGVDSHLKAYERAQKMLWDLESLMKNGGDDRVEQRRLFDTVLGSSDIWQPQPCREHGTTKERSNNTRDEFGDENVNSFNIINNSMMVFPPTQKGIRSNNTRDDFGDENVNSSNSMVFPPIQKGIIRPMINHGKFNIDAAPFYSSNLTAKNSNHGGGGGALYPDKLKRTRSGNEVSLREKGMDFRGPLIKPEENKMVQKQSKSPEDKEEDDKWSDLLLPDSKEFEEAIIAAVLGSSSNENGGKKKTVESSNEKGPLAATRKIEKRLKVFEDITLCMSPRA